MSVVSTCNRELNLKKQKVAIEKKCWVSTQIWFAETSSPAFILLIGLDCYILLFLIRLLYNREELSITLLPFWFTVFIYWMIDNFISRGKSCPSHLSCGRYLSAPNTFLNFLQVQSHKLKWKGNWISRVVTPLLLLFITESVCLVMPSSCKFFRCTTLKRKSALWSQWQYLRAHLCSSQRFLHHNEIKPIWWAHLDVKLWLLQGPGRFSQEKAVWE